MKIIIGLCLSVVVMSGCTATTSNNANLRNANSNTGYVVNSNSNTAANSGSVVDGNSNFNR